VHYQEKQEMHQNNFGASVPEVHQEHFMLGVFAGVGLQHAERGTIYGVNVWSLS
jgi:hypothetical protein